MMPVITAEQQKQFDEIGYFVLGNVFSAHEMDAVAASIEGFQKKHEEMLAASGETNDISRAGEIAFTGHLAENDPAIAKFVTRPELVYIATQLLGPDCDLFWNQSVFKQPEGNKEFPWHQDDAYAPVTPSPYLTLWLALNDATPENGCISVLPGSHKRGLVPHKASPIGLVGHDAADPNQGVLVPVKAGSMAVFHSLTMHKSGVNSSQGPRKAYVIQYSKAGLRNAATGELMPCEISLTRNGIAVN